MKEHQHKKFAGLWIDHQHAILIATPEHTAHGDYGVVGKVKSSHHAFHSTNENASNHQKHAELEKYFKEVSKHLEGFDEVLVFGPGKAQEQLVNHLNSDKHFQSKKFVLATAGSSLSENQMRAQVADHFKKYTY